MIQYYLFFPLFLLLFNITSFQVQEDSNKMRVISYNIRYNSADDAKKGHGWEIRKHEVVKLLKFYKPDLIGMQEVLKEQLDFLESSLKDYERVGVGRDDGKEAGEYAPVFFKKDVFTLKDKGTFWLSKNPEKPGKSWDAALPRICTWVKLENKETAETLFFFNTHFDHRGDEARKESAALITRKIKEMCGENEFVLTGDFNLTPETDPIKLLKSEEIIADSKDVAEMVLGPDGTFSGFVLGGTPLKNRIDYVFVSSKMKVENYLVLNNTYGDNYPSDHLPVLADVIL